MRRPWQGTLLAVLYTIGLVLLGLVVLLLLITFVGGGAMFGEMLSGAPGIGGMMGLLGSIIIVPLALLFVLNFFITRGLYKGQKWSVILVLIFTALGFIGAAVEVKIASIIINGLLIWAEIFCLRHPFYGKKKA